MSIIDTIDEMIFDPANKSRKYLYLGRKEKIEFLKKSDMPTISFMIGDLLTKEQLLESVTPIMYQGLEIIIVNKESHLNIG